jgi:hypothetical protein
MNRLFIVIIMLFLLLLIFTSKYSEATVLLTDDFETGTWSTNWSECYSCDNLSVVNTLAHGGSYSCKIHYVYDEEDAHLDKYNLTYTELYVSWWQRLTVAWDVGSKNLKVAATPSASEDYEGHVLLQLEQSNMSITVYKNSPSNFWADYPIPANTWVKMAFYIKYNTVGQSNGILRLYKNDVLAYENTNLVLRTVNDVSNTVWIGGNFSGGGSPPNPAFDRYMDDICVGNTSSDCNNETNIPFQGVSISGGSIR